MFYWIYDLPTWALGGLISFVFVAVTCLGIVVFRPLVHRWMRHEHRANDLVGLMLSCFAVFYGLLLGLIAVAAFQTYSTIDDNVNREAAVLTSMYHMVSNYPEPKKEEMQGKLRDFTWNTIHVVWPLQQQGQLAPDGNARMNDIYATLLDFEPTTKSQEIIHAETLRQLNAYAQLRRDRLASVTAGIPPVLWYVVAIGAVLNIVLIWLFDMEVRVHLILGGILALFMGMVIFMIAAMDNPFRGEVSISVDPIASVYDGLMKSP